MDIFFNVHVLVFVLSISFLFRETTSVAFEKTIKCLKPGLSNDIVIRTSNTYSLGIHEAVLAKAKPSSSINCTGKLWHDEDEVCVAKRLELTRYVRDECDRNFLKSECYITVKYEASDFDHCDEQYKGGVVYINVMIKGLHKLRCGTRSVTHIVGKPNEPIEVTTSEADLITSGFPVKWVPFQALDCTIVIPQNLENNHVRIAILEQTTEADDGSYCISSKTTFCSNSFWQITQYRLYETTSFTIHADDAEKQPRGIKYRIRMSAYSGNRSWDWNCGNFTFSCGALGSTVGPQNLTGTTEATTATSNTIQHSVENKEAVIIMAVVIPLLVIVVSVLVIYIIKSRRNRSNTQTGISTTSKEEGIVNEQSNEVAHRTLPMVPADNTQNTDPRYSNLYSYVKERNIYTYAYDNVQFTGKEVSYENS